MNKLHLAAVVGLTAFAAVAEANEPPCPAPNPRAPFHIVAVATHFVTQRPIRGAIVTLSHRMNCSKRATRPGEPQCVPSHPHPAEVIHLRCATGADGRVSFAVPDLDYEVAVKAPEQAAERYLESGELARYARALQPRELLQQESYSADRHTRTVTTKLVPASVVEAPSVIRSEDRAIEIARGLFAKCLALPEARELVPTTQDIEGEWWVTFAKPRPRIGYDRVGPAPGPSGAPIEDLGSVTINALTGDARIARCAAECCKDPKDAPSSKTPYPPADAITDALSGPLEYIGTGSWPGIFQIPSCAYRNARVVVIDVYCTRKEINTFSVLVYHPERGRVQLYAEARAPISTLERGQYVIWKAHSDELPATPALALSATREQLTAYEERRNALNLPGCWAEHWTQAPPGRSMPPGRCYKKTKEVEAAWNPVGDAFLQTPPEGWYPLVKTIRALAERHGGVDPRK